MPVEPSRMFRSRCLWSIALPGFVVGGLAFMAGCGSAVSARDVVGMRLDAAHREFEALDINEFEDVDVVGQEDPIWRDANWIVVKQTPAAGTAKVDAGTRVRLEVGHQDDREVLELIPPDSDFALERAEAMKKSEKVKPSSVPAQRPAPTSTTQRTDKPTENPEAEARRPTAKRSVNEDAVACANRKGNPGEIYVWSSYGSDEPPGAFRLGAGYVWLHGDKRCVTSTEVALIGTPRLPGYCTEVGKVSANPGYDVDARPARRIPRIIGATGDC